MGNARRQDGRQDQRHKGNHKVSDEKGALLGGRRRTRRNVGGRIGAEYFPRCEFPRIVVEEELAECAIAVREEYNGTCTTIVLIVEQQHNLLFASLAHK